MVNNVKRRIFAMSKKGNYKESIQKSNKKHDETLVSRRSYLKKFAKISGVASFSILGFAFPRTAKAQWGDYSEECQVLIYGEDERNSTSPCKCSDTCTCTCTCTCYCGCSCECIGSADHWAFIGSPSIGENSLVPAANGKSPEYWTKIGANFTINYNAYHDK